MRYSKINALLLLLSFVMIVSAAQKVQVQTTLFPLYDFARTIGGDYAAVNFLLPPGAEPHSYEPTPREVVAVKESDLFIYTGPFMEPWVGTLADGKARIVNASNHIELHSGSCEHDDDHDNHEEEHHEAVDPHIWTNPLFTIQIINNILEGYIAVDKAHASYYRAKADSLKSEIMKLDQAIRATLASSCASKTLYTGGHFAFGYFTTEYGLEYVTAYKGTTPGTQPSSRELIRVIEAIKKSGAGYLFFEELITPRVAQTIAKESGAELLLLHGAHNVSKAEMQSGVTYLAIMKQNLKNIKKALECK